ncbi:hypothetical protein D3C81_884650 [compost metagenome]
MGNAQVFQNGTATHRLAVKSDKNILPVMVMDPVHPYFNIIFLLVSIGGITALTSPMTALIHKQNVESLILEHACKLS